MIKLSFEVEIEAEERTDAVAVTDAGTAADVTEAVAPAVIATSPTAVVVVAAVSVSVAVRGAVAADSVPAVVVAAAESTRVVVTAAPVAVESLISRTRIEVIEVVPVAFVSTSAEGEVLAEAVEVAAAAPTETPVTVAVAISFADKTELAAVALTAVSVAVAAPTVSVEARVPPLLASEVEVREGALKDAVTTDPEAASIAVVDWLSLAVLVFRSIAVVAALDRSDSSPVLVPSAAVNTTAELETGAG